MPLVLIESPNKISKLSKILGSNYTIMASVGHIMDLSKKNMGIDVKTFEASYKINSDKKDIAKEIKREAKNQEVLHKNERAFLKPLKNLIFGLGKENYQTEKMICE